MTATKAQALNLFESVPGKDSVSMPNTFSVSDTHTSLSVEYWKAWKYFSEASVV
jgi:hypothetical protein